MKLHILPQSLSVCQVEALRPEDLTGDLCFVGRTDEELSLVCPTDRVPESFLACDDGWRAFRIQGVLDFSLIGILAPIAALLAENKIGIFAVSTYNTDYILVRETELAHAQAVLTSAGYEFC